MLIVLAPVSLKLNKLKNRLLYHLYIYLQTIMYSGNTEYK